MKENREMYLERMSDTATTEIIFDDCCVEEKGKSEYSYVYERAKEAGYIDGTIASDPLLSNAYAEAQRGSAGGCLSMKSYFESMKQYYFAKCYYTEICLKYWDTASNEFADYAGIDPVDFNAWLAPAAAYMFTLDLLKNDNKNGSSAAENALNEEFGNADSTAFFCHLKSAEETLAQVGSFSKNPDDGTYRFEVNDEADECDEVSADEPDDFDNDDDDDLSNFMH